MSVASCQLRESRGVAKQSSVASGQWRWFGIIYLLLLSLPSSAQDEPAQFKVDVRLVNIFLSVTNAKGVPTGGLQKENFAVFEDGAPQEIKIFQRESALPLSIALEIDTSLSTRKDLKLELEAARRFVHATVRPEADKLAIYTISENVDEVLPFTGDLKRIDHAISNVHSGAATALFDGLYLGSEALKGRQGRKVVVLITDGGDTFSHTTYQEALRSSLEAEAIIYSIIVVPIESNAGRNTGGEHALIQASEDTGGRYYFAKDVAQITAAFQQISDELRTQYLLAYYPSKRLADSDFRRIQVKLVGVAGGEGLKAHYRTGYYTH